MCYSIIEMISGTATEPAVWRMVHVAQAHSRSRRGHSNPGAVRSVNWIIRFFGLNLPNISKNIHERIAVHGVIDVDSFYDFSP